LAQRCSVGYHNSRDSKSKPRNRGRPSLAHSSLHPTCSWPSCVGSRRSLPQEIREHGGPRFPTGPGTSVTVRARNAWAFTGSLIPCPRLSHVVGTSYAPGHRGVGRGAFHGRPPTCTSERGTEASGRPQGPARTKVKLPAGHLGGYTKRGWGAFMGSRGADGDKDRSRRQQQAEADTRQTPATRSRKQATQTSRRQHDTGGGQRTKSGKQQGPARHWHRRAPAPLRSRR